LGARGGGGGGGGERVGGEWAGEMGGGGGEEGGGRMQYFGVGKKTWGTTQNNIARGAGGRTHHVIRMRRLKFTDRRRFKPHNGTGSK